MAGRPVLRVVAAVVGAGVLAAGCGGAAEPLPTAPAVALRAQEYSPPVTTGGAAAAPLASAAPSAAASAPAPPAPAATAAPTPPPSAPPAPVAAGSDVGPPDLYPFSCDDSEAAVAASGAPHVAAGSGAVYVGAEQVAGDNQDPRVVRFDGGRQVWCRDDLETSGDDGRAYGLLWSGDALYVAVSAVGTQGDPDGDLRRYTGSGWLTSYSDASPGGGGGAKASVVVRLDPATGAGVTGTWLTAVTADGRTNSLIVTSLVTEGGAVVVGTDAWYSPRGADRRPLSCTGGSPFPTTYTFTPDLDAVLDVRSRGCTRR
jgi:hypothetical protein